MKDMAKSTSDPAADDQKQSEGVRDDLDKKRRSSDPRNIRRKTKSRY